MGANLGKPAVRVFALVLLGCVLVQTAWSLAVPTFRGVDEYEHVYKAAAVARGDWSPHHRPSPTQWGEVVVVPADLVEAARPSCESLPETHCDPLGPAGPGLVEMPSSAGRYNPVFYSMIGTAALPLSGDLAVYAMRATAGLLCAGLVALCVLTVGRWSRTSWPAASVLIACTPMFTYSTMLPSPNGIEMAGGLLVWSALLGLVRDDVSPRDLRFFVTMALIGATPLLVVRSLGPLWLLLILVCSLPMVSSRHLGRLARTPVVRRAALALALVATSAAAYTWWAGTNEVGENTEHFGYPSVGDLLGQVILWFVQTAGVFPARDELASLWLYIVAFVTWWVVTAVAWRHSRRPERIALVAVVVTSVTVALAVTIASYDAAGAIWQGRYSLPLTVGYALICGRMLDRRASTVSARRGLAALTVFFVVLHAWSILGVTTRLQAQGPLGGSAAPWLAIPLVVSLILAGSLLLHRGLRLAPGARAAVEEPAGAGPLVREAQTSRGMLT